MSDIHGLIKDLGGGLILRRAIPEDTESLAEFNSRVHSDDGWEKPFAPAAVWTRDLMTKDHPTFSPGDFTIVEDTATKQIVSSLNLISQTWSYAGIPFKVGRPELVGTHPDYRNRGLVRAQFEVVHQWSAERGELLQAITGIPYYYRQFGYEMAMNLGGGRIGYLPHIPKLGENEDEPYIIRPAVEADLAFIASTYQHASQRYLVACLRSKAEWRYELLGHDPKSVNYFRLAVIETPSGEARGFIAHGGALWGTSLSLIQYELKPGVSWLAVTPSVVRYLQKVGEAMAAEEGSKPYQAHRFSLGEEHPVYEAHPNLAPRLFEPYTWYLRLPDMLAFLKLITPVLEERLAKSVACGHSGELKLTFYGEGLRFDLESGKIKSIEPYQPAPTLDRGDAAFPGRSFAQLLFGWRSISEMVRVYPDCWVGNDPARALLNAFFTRQISNVWPLN